MISSYLYDVCSTYDVCLPVWCLPTCMMPALQCVVCPAVCLSACLMSACLYTVCSTRWSLLDYTMTAYLYDVRSIVWRLPTYIYDFFPGYLHDACLSVWWLSYLYDGPAYFYDVFLTVCVCSLLRYLPSFISAYWYDVCLPVICLPSCKVWTQLYNVRLPV